MVEFRGDLIAEGTQISLTARAHCWQTGQMIFDCLPFLACQQAVNVFGHPLKNQMCWRR